MKLGEAIYKASSQENNSQAPESNDADGIVDAEFEDVDDTDRKHG